MPHTQLESELGLGQPLPVSGVSPTALLWPFTHFLSHSLLRLPLLSSGCVELSVVPILLYACPLCSLITLLHDNPDLVRDEGVPLAGGPYPTARVCDGAQTSPSTNLAQSTETGWRLGACAFSGFES